MHSKQQEIYDYEDMKTQALLRVHLFAWSV